jgi:hypothetical protein
MGHCRHRRRAGKSIRGHARAYDLFMKSALAAAVAVAALGCAHMPKGRVEALGDGDRVCAGDVCYRIGALGERWRLVHVEGASVGYFSHDVGGVIEANASCRDDAEASPLPTLTRTLLIGYTERKIESQAMVPLDRREALRTRVAVKLDGVPMTLELYVMKRNGCIFDLSYAAPPDAFARGSDDFQRFVDGFADAREAKAARGGS